VINIDKVLFSTGKDDWETPEDLFNHFNKIFNFDLDVCADKKNKKLKRYLSEKDNALIKDWDKKNWCNPPYSNGNQWKFIRKAYEESLKGKLTVCLIPARPDTKAWHDYVMKADHIQYIKGRLRFVGAKSSAPFPSCIVIFGLRYLKKRYLKNDKNNG
jgi:site-specific DNA-methyltransferase (adenine-specific)